MPRKRRKPSARKRPAGGVRPGVEPEVLGPETEDAGIDVGQADDLLAASTEGEIAGESAAEGEELLRAERGAPRFEPLAEAGEGSGEERPDEEAAAALVPFDPLSRYLAEIRRFPLLTREEESVIAKRYQKDKDPADAYRLVTANLRLVVKIAMEFARSTRNLLDLIQEGNVGLMEGVKNFDPYRGIRFPSYAVWWVRAYIYRYLVNNWRLVKIGTTQAQRKLFFNLKKETERLEAEGFRPEPKLLAQRIGVKENEVREMQERMGHSELSLDQPVAAAEETRLLDILPDTAGGPEDEAASDEWRDFAKEKVAEFASTLKDKEAEIFRSRLLAEEPATLQEIGERFGISRERVRQIETRLKKRLKEFIKSQTTGVEHAES